MPSPYASVADHDPLSFYAPDAVEEHVPVDAIVHFVGYGTGVVLPGGHTVLTCLHVARGPREHASVRLGEHVVQLEIFATAPALDLALYRSEAPLGPGISVRPTRPVVGEPVLVVGHPGDRPVSVSYGAVLRTGLRVASVPALSYDAVTDWGSSGSVVVDAAGRAVAVHWAWDDEDRFGGGLLGIPLLDAAARWPALAEALGVR